MRRASRADGSWPSRGRAFTLIELLVVVVVVISVLASLVAPNVLHRIGAAKDTTARWQSEMLGVTLHVYRLDNGEYPMTQHSPKALWTARTDLRAGSWRGAYLRNAVPLDPWGYLYIYRPPGQQTRVGDHFLRYGAGGQSGGEGDDADIASWQ